MAVDNWLIALSLRSFAALVLLTGTLLAARWLYPQIGDGAVKRLLYDATLRKRHPWRFAVACFAASWGIGLLALYFV